MDLIYANDNREDVGVLHDYTLDMAFGQNENDFECTVASDHHCCDTGYFLYMENTEYGGIVDRFSVDTGKEEITYNGRTWQGILDTRVILPLASTDASTSTVTITDTDSSGASLLNKYLILSGDANRVIEWLIARMGLSDLFRASAEDSGIMISSYKMNRYVKGYSGIMKMLKASGAKLKIRFRNGKAELSAEAIVDYSKDEQFDSDLFPLEVSKIKNQTNHLICLGSGELEERVVLHLYTDASGNISTEQSLFGMDEVVAVFEYPNAESVEELQDSGKDKLKEAWNHDVLRIDFDATDNSYDIGDIVGAKEHITGVSASASVTKKIVKIQNGTTTISYKVGE